MANDDATSRLELVITLGRELRGVISTWLAMRTCDAETRVVVGVAAPETLRWVTSALLQPSLVTQLDSVAPRAGFDLWADAKAGTGPVFVPSSLASQELTRGLLIELSHCLERWSAAHSQLSEVDSRVIGVVALQQVVADLGTQAPPHLRERIQGDVSAMLTELGKAGRGAVGGGDAGTN